jgi:hypothetical protein
MIAELLVFFGALLLALTVLVLAVTWPCPPDCVEREVGQRKRRRGRYL